LSHRGGSNRGRSDLTARALHTRKRALVTPAPLAPRVKRRGCRSRVTALPPAHDQLRASGIGRRARAAPRAEPVPPAAGPPVRRPPTPGPPAGDSLTPQATRPLSTCLMRYQNLRLSHFQTTFLSTYREIREQPDLQGVTKPPNFLNFRLRPHVSSLTSLLTVLGVRCSADHPGRRERGCDTRGRRGSACEIHHDRRCDHGTRRR
jgi:hypothetical protein